MKSNRKSQQKNNRTEISWNRTWVRTPRNYYFKFRGLKIRRTWSENASKKNNNRTGFYEIEPKFYETNLNFWNRTWVRTPRNRPRIFQIDPPKKKVNILKSPSRKKITENLKSPPSEKKIWEKCMRKIWSLKNLMNIFFFVKKCDFLCFCDLMCWFQYCSTCTS